MSLAGAGFGRRAAGVALGIMVAMGAMVAREIRAMGEDGLDGMSILIVR